MNKNPNEIQDTTPDGQEKLPVEPTAELSTEPVAAEATTKKAKSRKAHNLRRLRYGSTSTAITVIVIAVVVLLNMLVGILADRFPLSLDLSGDKIYTISDESIAVAKAIPDEMEIVVFLSEDTFTNSTVGANSGIPEFDTVLKEFYNLLKQYRSFSGNKVNYSFIDPDQEPTKYAAYSVYEVSAGDVLFLLNDMVRKFTIEELYDLDTSNYYTTGSYTFESKVEKTMASTINTMVGGNERIVQVLVGHEEDSGVISGLKSLYELNGYTFEENTITASKDFNEKAEVMLIAAPAQDYTADEIKRVQQWVYNNGNYGHHLLVFANATAACPNLFDFLSIEYGLQVTDEIIIETDFARIQNYNQLYPMCDIPETDFTKNSAGTAKVFTPQARRITTTLEAKDAESNIGTFSTTITNYPDSAQLITLSDYNSDSQDKAEKVYSADESAYPLSNMIACVIDSYNNDTGKEATGNVVVCGSPLMAYTNVITTSSYQNEELLLDTVNGMTGAEAALSISNKRLSEDTVTFNGNTQLVLGIGVFMVGLPVLLLILCLVVFMRRKNL